MTESKSEPATISGFLAKLKQSGEAAFEELSGQLMENELFLSAMRKSLEAKSHVDKTVSGTMDFVNVPSKNDVTRLLEEIEAIRSRLVKQQRALKELQKSVDEIKSLLATRGDE
jgi:hypothetical protein